MVYKTVLSKENDVEEIKKDNVHLHLLNQCQICIDDMVRLKRINYDVQLVQEDIVYHQPQCVLLVNNHSRNRSHNQNHNHDVVNVHHQPLLNDGTMIFIHIIKRYLHQHV